MVFSYTVQYKLYNISTKIVLMSTNFVEIYTDGACRGNPGPGGWGVSLRYNGNQKDMYGSEPETTNNRMELTACLLYTSDAADDLQPV